jgi:hypothetical protein
MGEATLLEFNGVDVGHCISKDPLLVDFIQEGPHFEIKDTCNNIRTITPQLAREESHLNILPLGVGSSSNEQIRLGPKGSSNSI